MKKILLVSLVAVIVLLLLGYVGFVIARAPRYAPTVPSGELSLENAAQLGLHIDKMSVEEGLTGWYERDEYIVYFGSKRAEVNPWIERILFEAPKFATYTAWEDNRDMIFIGNVGGDGSILDLPDNQKVSEIDQTENVLNFILSSEAIALLKQTSIDPALDYEYDALINSEVPEEEYFNND